MLIMASWVLYKLVFYGDNFIYTRSQYEQLEGLSGGSISSFLSFFRANSIVFLEIMFILLSILSWSNCLSAYSRKVSPNSHEVFITSTHKSFSCHVCLIPLPHPFSGAGDMLVPHLW